MMKSDESGAEQKASFFGDPIVVVNVGIRPFYDELKGLDVRVSQVEWEPPAGGDEDLVALLDKIL
jgi:FdrA protein